MLAFVIDRDTGHRVMASVSLAFLGYEVMQFGLAEEAIAAARSLMPSLVLAETFYPGGDEASPLEIIGKLYPRCLTIAMLSSPEAPAGPLSTQLPHPGAGATVAKPVDHADLSAAVQRARRFAMAPSKPEQSFTFKPGSASASAMIDVALTRKQA
jgi:DNA-binding NtrC family response regulator